MFSKGFTLIELLVVMGIFLAVSAVAGAILFSSLRGSEKTATLDQVRQNGNYALSVMTKLIRNAKTLDYPTSASCLNSTTVAEIKFTPQDGSNQTIFRCNEMIDGLPTIASNGSSLLDTKQVSLIPNNCSFICVQTSGAQPPNLKIKFTLSEAGTTTFVEKKATVPFETSVTLRNR